MPSDAVALPEGTVTVLSIDHVDFRTRLWRMLARRAQAREATGDGQGARDDCAAARALIDDMARRIADPELRAAFEADPAIVEVRSA